MKNVVKTFGSLKQSITFAAAKTKRAKFTNTTGKGIEERLKKIKRYLADKKK